MAVSERGSQPGADHGEHASRPEAVASNTPTPSGSAALGTAGPVEPEAAVEAAYDQRIPSLIPGYASLARLSVALLAASPLASTATSAVLVAGCGTGAELLEARAQRPDWRLTGLDPSEAMLNLARARLGISSGITWCCCKVEELEADQAFDGALAVLVLQSLPDDGRKLGFLTALARQLRPGAQLVLVDLMQPERSPLQEQVGRAWLGFQRASGWQEAWGDGSRNLAGPCHPIGPARLNALLDAAGFGDPALIFQALNFAGYLVQRRG